MMQSSNSPSLRQRLAGWIAGGSAPQPAALAAAAARVDDDPGWASLTGRPHDHDPARIQELYQDALQAWRRNPIAWRIISITSDYVVGDRLQVSSPHRGLQRFLTEFWHHPKNRMDLRLEAMCDELCRAGDLFVLLFRNDQDGMSYLRFVTKDNICAIDSASNDWETELVYHERQDSGEDKRWYAPQHPDAPRQPAVMLHYSVNRPLGALLGESDLTTMIPWLLRYSRMLEDRVRLHWAVRAFLWLVTVPANRVKAKQEQYRRPPEAGSIVVKDESEKWEVYSPLLRGSDASHDLQAVRNMIDAGSGYPPHWRGEAGEANLATATAMQAPTERHLHRRQKYFIFLLQDILYHAYQRAVEVGAARKLASSDYNRLFTVSAPDISRSDNRALAAASLDLARAFESLSGGMQDNPALSRQALRLAFKFAGEPLAESELEDILAHAGQNKENTPSHPQGERHETQD